MKQDTIIVSAGRDPQANHGIVNPPVYHASTILHPTLKALRAASGKDYRSVVYGRYGTPTTFALQQAMAELEGGDWAIACGSGKAVIATVLMAFLKTGDHVLITDSAYQPTRNLATGLLKDFGVETTFYDPTIGAGIADLMRPNTKLVYTESPGSVTFEVQDLPAIAEAAHAKGAVVACDNTWGAGYFYRPLDLGADISLQAGTKYIVGHSDAMLGIAVAREEHMPRLWETYTTLGNNIGPDDAYLGQRGLRTLAVRMRRHHESGLKVAQWLAERPEVLRVLHPGLPDDPGHALWQRDFTGAAGLFSVLIKPVSESQLAAMLDPMELFGMGYSWGGYESLIVPSNPRTSRTAVPWQEEGTLLRLHVGLEDTDDLIAELEAGLHRLASTG
jgi:cystathionine beta-lyase